MSKSFLIGDLAKITGIPTATIRYYEKIGLLPKPLRTEGNYRFYREGHLNRLQFIKRSRMFGFPIEKIKELLDYSEGQVLDREPVKQLVEFHLKEVEAKLAELKELKTSLKNLISSCPKGQISGCGIIDSLNGHFNEGIELKK